MTFEFEIETVLSDHGIVLARALDKDINPVLSGNMRLNNTSVMFMDIPRTIDNEGNQRKDLFVFTLVDYKDINEEGISRLFKPKDRVTLHVEEALPSFLHIYAQLIQHEEACIAGSRKALTDLKNAIDRALIDGQSNTEFSVNDGEGYDLWVIRTEGEVTDRLRRPYRDDSAKDTWQYAVNWWNLIKRDK